MAGRSSTEEYTCTGPHHGPSRDFQELGASCLALSKLIRPRYNLHAECPQFMEFLNRIMGSHPDASEFENVNAERLVFYLQKVFGCAASGRPEKLLFVLYGEGNNGKTTLLEVIQNALGRGNALDRHRSTA